MTKLRDIQKILLIIIGLTIGFYCFEKIFIKTFGLIDFLVIIIILFSIFIYHFIGGIDSIIEEEFRCMKKHKLFGGNFYMLNIEGNNAKILGVIQIIFAFVITLYIISYFM